MSKSFLVIGGGPVGILSSILLSKKGYEVTLVEAGEVNKEAMLGSDNYSFKSSSKFPIGVHQLGGGSNFWHGRVSQFSKRALTSIESHNSVWPFSIEEYLQAHTELLKFLELPHVEAMHKVKEFICCSLCDSLFEVVPYLFSPPQLLKDMLLKSTYGHNIKIFYRAYAKSIRIKNPGEKVTIEILSDSTNVPKFVSADKIVVTAGCLQSTALIHRSFPNYFENHSAGAYLMEHFDGYIGKLKVSSKSSTPCLAKYRLGSDRKITDEIFGLGIRTKYSSSLSWHLEVAPHVRHYAFDPVVNRFNLRNRKILITLFFTERLLFYPLNQSSLLLDRVKGLSNYSLWLKGEELPFKRSILKFNRNSETSVQKIVYNHKISTKSSLIMKRELRKFREIIKKNHLGKIKFDWWFHIPFFFRTGGNWHPMGTLRLGFPDKGPLNESFQLGLHNDVMVLDSSSFPIGGHHNPTSMSLTIAWLVLNKLPDVTVGQS
jgi:hypothetical protein